MTTRRTFQGGLAAVLAAPAGALARLAGLRTAEAVLPVSAMTMEELRGRWASARDSLPIVYPGRPGSESWAIAERSEATRQAWLRLWIVALGESGPLRLSDEFDSVIWVDSLGYLCCWSNNLRIKPDWPGRARPIESVPVPEPVLKLARELGLI